MHALQIIAGTAKIFEKGANGEQVQKTPQSAFDECIRSFTAKDDTSSTAAGSVDGKSDSQRLAAAPPCFGWNNLVLLSSLKQKHEVPNSVDSVRAL